MNNESTLRSVPRHNPTVFQLFEIEQNVERLKKQEKKSRVLNCGHNRLLHSDFTKKDAAKNVSDAKTAVATSMTQERLAVVGIRLTKRDLSLKVMAICDPGLSFADKFKLKLQGQKASLSVAGIHGSQDVKTEIVPIAVSPHEKSQPLTLFLFYVQENWSWVTRLCKYWRTVIQISETCQTRATIWTSFKWFLDLTDTWNQKLARH